MSDTANAQAQVEARDFQKSKGKDKKAQSNKQGGGRGGGGGGKGGSTKLRGLDKDSPEVRTSKTLSWLLRHAAASESLPMRPDGYVKVTDLVSVLYP